MALELRNTDKLSIKSMGILLTPKSTQVELARALELNPSLSAYIVENKSIKKDGKESNKIGTEKT